MGGLRRQVTNKTSADPLVRKRKRKEERCLQEEKEDKTQNLYELPKQKTEKKKTFLKDTREGFTT